MSTEPCRYIFEPIGKLYPTYPGQDTSRYKSSKRSQYMSIAVDADTYSSPTYLPPLWSAHVQPEGKPYFHHSGLLVSVTESWMYSPEIATEAEQWIEHLTLCIKAKGIDLASSELYIRIDEDKDCLYYGVNKRDQTLFWIEDYETEDLGLPGAVSPSHLRSCLEFHYWTHIERFPAHFGGLPESTLLKLLDVLTHARMDQITSVGSTFTYTGADTKALHDLLKDCRGRTQESEIVSTIARIWHLVQYNRFYNQYGEETPRLDVSMSVIDSQATERLGLSKRFLSLFSFGKSEQYRVKLNSLFVDEYVYAFRVDAFMQDLLREWKDQYLPSFFMLLLHIVFFQLIASETVAAISAACFSASLLTSFVLVQQHDGLLDNKHSCVAVNWLSDRVSKRYKYQRLSFAFALPRTFFNWGLIFFFGHWLFIGLSHLSTRVAVTFVAVLGLAILAFIAVTDPDSIPTMPTVPLPFQKQRASDDESMV